MGDALCYSCSSCQNQKGISTDIMRALEGMQSISMEHVDDLIKYIDEFISRIDTGGHEPINKPTSLDSFINSGRDLTKSFSKRLNRHVCKKFLLSALDRRTTKVVCDVASQAQPIPYLGMAFSIIAHLLERSEQVSSNNEHIIQLLYSMSTLAKHTRNLGIHLDRPKLDDILPLIVKGTLMCALHMEPNNVFRYIFAPLDAADLESLKSQLDFSYQNLALEGVTAALDRQPNVPDPSQGEYPHNSVGIEEARNKVIELLDLNGAFHRVVVIYGVGGIGKTTLATAVFNLLDLTSYHYCRVDMDQDSKHSDLLLKQEQILRDIFKENLKLNNCTQGREKLSELFRKASKSVFLFIDNALRETDIETLLPIGHLSGLPVPSRIFVTTRNLNETDIFQHDGGIPVYSHMVDSLSEPEAKRLLFRHALGDANGSFDPEVNIDGLLQICGGIPLVLKIVGRDLSRLGNTVSGCNEILEYIKDWQQKGFEGGDLSQSMVDFVYRRLKEPSKEAFLDIAYFFYNWERSKVADIVGEMQLRDLEGAALVTTSEEEEEGWMMDYWVKMKQVKVKMHDIVRARGRRLSEGTRITDKESLCIVLHDAQKLQRTKGIWLCKAYYDYYYDVDSIQRHDEKLVLEAKHLDLMSRTLRVLCLGHRPDDHTKVSGCCERAFEDLRFLSIQYEDMLPIDLTKSSRLVYFCGGFMEGHRLSQAKFNALGFKGVEYPHEEIMSRMFFNGGSRFLHVDGYGQLAEVASSWFPEVGVRVGLLLTACDLSNEMRHKLLEVASPDLQIIYVDVGVEVEGETEAEGSGRMEEREERIRRRLVQLPEESRAWTSRFHKTTLLFAYSLWCFTFLNTSLVGTTVLVDSEGRRKLSNLEMIYGSGRDGREFTTFFSPLEEASRWMRYD